MPEPVDPTPDPNAAPEPENLPDGDSPSGIFDDPLMASLHDNLKDILDAEDAPATPAPEGTEKPPAKPQSDVTGDPAKPEGEVAPEQPTVSLSRAKPATREDILSVLKEMREEHRAAAAAPVNGAASPESEDEMTEEEKEDLSLAEHAAKVNPEKYKDLPSKIRKFQKEQSDYLRDHASEYGRTFDDADEQWQRFLTERRPFLSDSERRRIEKDMWISAAEERAAQRYAKEKAESDARIRRLEAEPAIQKRAGEFASQLGEVMKDEGNALQKDIFDEKRRIATELATTLLRVRNGIEPFNAQNPLHAWLVAFIQRESTEFARAGGQERIRNGRQFVPAEQYIKLSDAHRARSWTFDDNDILLRIQKHADMEARAEFSARHEKNIRMGYAPQAKPASRESRPAPQPTKPATPAPGRAPGAVVEAPKENDSPARDIFEIRGLPLPGESAPM